MIRVAACLLACGLRVALLCLCLFFCLIACCLCFFCRLYCLIIEPWRVLCWCFYVYVCVLCAYVCVCVDFCHSNVWVSESVDMSVGVSSFSLWIEGKAQWQ